ncbi:MAG: hypothetical protein R8G66_10415 [Cytophagales bacterium]|nr:hypothetical protein [Cytophagales bacterium]
MYIAAIHHKCVITYAISAFILLSCLPGRTQSFEQQIGVIEKYCKKIDKNLTAFSIQEMRGFEFSNQGNEATKFFDNQALVKVDAADFTKEFRQERAFYLRKGELLMIAEVYYKYNAPIDQDEGRARMMGLKKWYDPEKTRKTTKVYYFQNDELIGMKARGKYQPRSEGDNYDEYEAYFLKLTESYLSPAENNE